MISHKTGAVDESAALLRTKTFCISCSQLRHPGNYGESAPSGGWACCPRHPSQDIARLAARRAARALPFLDSAPSVVPTKFQADDAQDDGQGKECFGAGDGTKDSGLGVSFGEPISINVEGGSPQQVEQEANDSPPPLSSLREAAYRITSSPRRRITQEKALATPTGFELLDYHTGKNQARRGLAMDSRVIASGSVP